MKQKVRNHASVAIVSSECSGEFLFDRYTDTYRIPAWRGCINLIGGNQSFKDSSPRDIWEREMMEEFYEPIAENLILNAKPYKDFLVKVPEVMEFRNDQIQKRDPLVIVHTVFETFLDQRLFEYIRDCLRTGKKIKNEGVPAIKKITDLTSGKVFTASATGLIMEDYLQHDVKIPNPAGVAMTTLGVSRCSLKEYLSDFEYELEAGDEEI